MKNKTRMSLLTVAVALAVTVLPAQSATTDDKIEKAARESYVFKELLKDDQIKVAARDGHVTLTGTVDKNSDRSLAEDTVAALPGVQHVMNELQVKDPRPLLQSDEAISAKVKAALLFHRNVSARNTQVTVHDGIVHLRGEAATNAERDLATEYARDIDGVKDVKNEMEIRAAKAPPPERTVGEKIDDASITAQVKATLLMHRSTSAVSTKVETRDGIVTLTGKATNAAQRDLVTKLVNDIHGVKAVKNEMLIEPSAG